MTHPLHDPKYSRLKSHDGLPDAAKFLYDGLPQNVRQLVSSSYENRGGNHRQQYGYIKERLGAKSWAAWKPSKTKIVLVILWIGLLYWGERSAFTWDVRACDWKNWERWPQEATPHHVVLLADPQLVDPHTYPGRPWPLSTFTLRHTDLYLRRSFSSLLNILGPDTLFFLGDLFDGGREWGRSREDIGDRQWRKYDKNFWLQEYDRFGRIFFDPWIEIGGAARHARDRKLIASLPGNHDLGLGNGIRLSVRQRFNTFFGEGNRVDVIANHTFVSVDTVSLSAKDQPDSSINVQTQSEGEAPGAEIWRVAEDFLSTVKSRKERAIDQELRSRNGKLGAPPHDHQVYELHDLAAGNIFPSKSTTSDLPTILLTHIPLYRSPGTPCGPLRERWPPSRTQGGSDGQLESDETNAIHVAAGYQYQNVLMPAISKEIIEKIGNVERVFSGDDHDYCEVIHRGYTSNGGGIREITVKSMSWAMGVRKPGFLLLSLWNPIDELGPGQSPNEPGMTQAEPGVATAQTYLCLLPDQLGIFIRYGILLGFTLLFLILRAAVVVYTESRRPNVSHESRARHVQDEEKMFLRRDELQNGSSSSKWSNPNGLLARSGASRTRCESPANEYGIPKVGISESPLLPEEVESACNGMNRSPQDLSDTIPRYDPLCRRRTGVPDALDEFRWSVLQVASVPIFWYAWLVWTSP